ncbi:MAG: phosphatidate cytidylyltransferase [Chloroflexia bacterium]
MRTRIVSGVVLLGLAGVIVAVRGPLLVLGLLAAIAICANEFYGMAAAAHRPWRLGGIALALLFALPASLVALGVRTGLLIETSALVAAGAGLLATLAWVGIRRTAAVRGDAGDVAAGRDDPLAAWTDVGLTLGGALYTGGILQYGLRLNHPPGEGWWLLLVVLATAAADTGAYFTGRAFGKRKLIPHISPNKTWEGFWGGLALCVVTVALFSVPMGIPAWHVPLLGAAIALGSVIGDLCESMLKRSFGAKDSGRLIPGHGGLLDRLDSIMFVLLVVYGYMSLAA